MAGCRAHCAFLAATTPTRTRSRWAYWHTSGRGLEGAAAESRWRFLTAAAAAGTGTASLSAIASDCRVTGSHGGRARQVSPSQARRGSSDVPDGGRPADRGSDSDAPAASLTPQCQWLTRSGPGPPGQHHSGSGSGPARPGPAREPVTRQNLQPAAGLRVTVGTVTRTRSRVRVRIIRIDINLKVACTHWHEPAGPGACGGSSGGTGAAAGHGGPGASPTRSRPDLITASATEGAT
jgi:hypothetical protein